MEKPDEREGQREPRFSQEQYDMLKRCSDNKNMTEWNQWREENPSVKVTLQGAKLSGTNLRKANLKTANLYGAHLKGAILNFADLEHSTLLGADLRDAELFAANLRRARLGRGGVFEFSMQSLNDKVILTEDARHHFSADLRGARLPHADLRGAKLSQAQVQHTDFRWILADGETEVWNCQIDRTTDFRGVNLGTLLVDPGSRQLLEYNERRRSWQDWYKTHRRLAFLAKPFWQVSDYGRSTGRIATVFIGLSLVFAFVYYLSGQLASPGIVDNLFVDRNGVLIARWLVPFRSLYFSIVTMTTLGFGDMYANPHSVFGHILLSLQVILGYVLLGALVTRFAVLFTAGGPAGKFAEDKGMIERIREFMTKRFRRTKTQ